MSFTDTIPNNGCIIQPLIHGLVPNIGTLVSPSTILEKLISKEVAWDTCLRTLSPTVTHACAKGTFWGIFNTSLVEVFLANVHTVSWSIHLISNGHKNDLKMKIIWMDLTIEPHAKIPFGTPIQPFSKPICDDHVNLLSISCLLLIFSSMHTLHGGWMCWDLCPKAW